MRKITILFTALLLAAAPNNFILAKKDKKAEREQAKAKKQEIKEWKKRKKKMEPLQLKDLVEENSRLKAKNLKLEEEVITYKEEAEKVVKLKEELQKMQDLQAKKDQESSDESQEEWEDDGLGSHKALAKQGKSEISHGELMFKVQVGAFSDYWEANKLKEELRGQGKKTWIVCYNKQGERVSLKAVLKDILKK